MSILSYFPLDQFPLIAVWIIGLILSIVFWRRHPNVSLLSLIALMGFLIIIIAEKYLTFHFATREFAWSQVAAIYTIKSLISTILSAVFWVLLGFAVFGWRRKQDVTVEGEAKVDKDSKIRWVGWVSLILSGLIILIILGTLVIFIQIGSNIVRAYETNPFWMAFFVTSTNTYFFPLWVLPLGVLNIIMAVIARKNDSAVHKKIAVLGITVGTMGVIIGLWLSIYLYIYLITVH